jgi:hypothetical protein
MTVCVRERSAVVFADAEAFTSETAAEIARAIIITGPGDPPDPTERAMDFTGTTSQAGSRFCRYRVWKILSPDGRVGHAGISAESSGGTRGTGRAPG